MDRDIWVETMAEACEDAGLEASKEQIDTLASWAEGMHDNWGMATGSDCIPNPLEMENNELKRQLRNERDKITCPDCRGGGWITSQGPHHSATSQCMKCRGDGRVLP